MRSSSCIVFAAVFAVSVHGATYIVPGDRTMIEDSAAIVIGTVADSHARRTNGRIETVTEVRIEERIKGLDGALTVSVVHAGGQIGEEWMMQSGAPVFEKGERVLLFLRRNARGDWTTYALALGVFRYRGNTLSRGDEIVGWDEHGGPHLEQVRAERAFLGYVHGVVRGEARSSEYFVSAIAPPVTTEPAFTMASYTGRFNNDVSVPIRRRGNGLSVAWRLIGTQPGLDMERAVDRGNAAWNGQSALINYTRSPIRASGDRVDDDDGEHRVIANDPHDDSEGSCCPGVAATAWWSGSGTHSFNGVTFRTIEHSDIVVNDGVSASSLFGGQQELETIMTHELGHTLGLRHANQDNLGSAACTLPRDCCFNTVEGGDCRAVMNSSAIGGISGLQYWDKKAIDCVYHANCLSTTSCNPPEVRVQPRNVQITRGLAGQLSVFAAGTPPLRYQWYEGSSGDTSTPVGINSPQLPVAPQTTTSYWVRVTDPCGDPEDSHSATVSVIPCSFLRITSAWAATDPDGRISLRADATGIGLEYEWFRGTSPGRDGVSVGTRRTLNVTITEPTSFWVRVRNSCGANEVSDLVYAAPCGLPSIVAQPESRTNAAGAETMISVALLPSSTGDVVWYRGLPPDKSNVAGTGTNLVVAPATTTTYWGTVTNACGEIPMRAVTVYVTAADQPARRRSVRP